jgi:hypothetical protein
VSESLLEHASVFLNADSAPGWRAVVDRTVDIASRVPLIGKTRQARIVIAGSCIG